MDWQTPLKAVFDAVITSHYRYAAALALILFCSLARAYGTKLPWIGPKLKGGLFMWCFVVMVGGLGAIGNGLLAASIHAFKDVASAFAYGAFVGLAAAGLFKGVKEVEQAQKPKGDSLPLPPAVVTKDDQPSIFEGKLPRLLLPVTVLAFLLTACGASHQQQIATARSTVGVVAGAAAQATLVIEKWSEEREIHIANTAVSKEAGEKALLEHEGLMIKVDQGIAVTRTAILAATAALAALEADKGDWLAFGLAVKRAADASKDLMDAVQALVRK